MGFPSQRFQARIYPKRVVGARGSRGLDAVGLIPEFIGRVPVGDLDELDESALVMILTVPKTHALKQYQKLFEMESVKLKFTDGALRQVAQEALSQAGARGLRAILEEVMLDVMYDLPHVKT